MGQYNTYVEYILQLVVILRKWYCNLIRCGAAWLCQ